MAAEYHAGHVRQVSITDEMQSSYIDYAMSVIVARALPDVRDGLKPVHRRILYAMKDMGLTPDKGYKKSARVVGEVLGKYHPHGDSAVYATMARMAQSFSSRYPLVDGHGNFGSIDGDSPAAMRYTEARLSPIAMAMLEDLDEDTVDFSDNFDGTLEEPEVVTSRFPNLLVNGSSGIAVGMATNIPPHNLTEVINGVLAMVDEPEISSRDLMEIIPGPDFPTGGLITGRTGIHEAYTTGRGIITMRARTEIEERPGGGSRIIVHEIPFQVVKAKLIEKIAALVREKKIEGITDLQDETDRTGLRIRIDLAPHANARVVLNQLFKHTPLQQSFGIILLALVDGKPEVMNLRQIIYHYLEHQRTVVRRRTEYRLARAEARAHILEGLRIALDHIDAVIQLIRRSDTVEKARQGLIDQFDLSKKQAQAILDMRLRRLTGLEREDIEEEYQGLLADIEDYRGILADPERLDGVVSEELVALRDKFGDERRTTITLDLDMDLNIEDLIPQEDVVVTLSHQDYIKRIPLATYRGQRRGGRGIIGMNTKDEDAVEHLFVTNTHHYVLFFTNRGLVYRQRIFQIPEASRQAQGTPVVNLLEVEQDERVTAVIPIEAFRDDCYLLVATKRGIVKKTPLSDYDSRRSQGLIAVNLDDGDELIGVKLTDGSEDVLLATREGMSIRFSEEDVRPMGRTARGVIGIRLSGDDCVVGMQTVNKDADVLVVTENGFGKRTPVDRYRIQSRGGKGLKTINRTERTGDVIGVQIVEPGDEVMLSSAQGIIIRLDVDGISRQERNTQGVIVMRVAEDDQVVALARVVSGSSEDADSDQ